MHQIPVRPARAVGLTSAWVAAVALLVVQLVWSSVSDGWAADRTAATGALLGFVTVGSVIAHQRPRHVMGWLFLGVGVVPGIQMAAQAYARHAASGGVPSGPAIASAWLASIAFPPFLVMLLVLAPLLFPDGRLPSPRWRPVLWGAGGCLALGLPQAFAPGPLDLYDGEPYPADNPLAVDAVAPVLDVTDHVFFPLLMVLSLLALTSLAQRFHRARGDERKQVLWLLLPFLLLVLSLVVDDVLLPLLDVHRWVDQVLSDVLVASSLVLLPVAAGVAVLKHRLYTIDTIINRFVVYAALATLVTAAYAGVLLVAGTVTGDAAGQLPGLLAVALAAVSFHPLRTRLQRAVDQLLYGDRHDPLQAVARLGRQLADAPDPDLLPAVLQALATTMGSGGVQVSGADGALVASWGEEPSSGQPVRVPLRHGGERLGDILVAPRSAHEAYTRADRRILDALAPHVAVVLRAVQLNAELERARLHVLAAAEDERARLRRDLHDGLGPSLSGVALGLEAAVTTAGTARPVPLELLTRLHTEVRGSIEEVRRIIGGLRPLALDELGLVRAIRSRATDITERTTASGRCLLVDVVAPDTLAVDGPDVELAAYRIVDEALTNVVRHTSATHCRVVLAPGAERGIDIQVVDDGGGLSPHDSDRGHDGHGIPSMRARAEALGGSVHVVSAAAGVLISASLPSSGRS